MRDERRENHESYGLIQISRVSGSNTNLFGSSIKHNNTIVIKIREGELIRHLNKDWYHAKKEYVEIEMSNTQFAEAITTLNSGSGVPCTIRYLDGKEMKKCPHTDKRQEFEDEFQSTMKEINQKLKKLTEDTERILSDKKPPTKSNKEAILNQIQMLRQEIESNIPFVYKQFNEQMDKTVLEAKGEVEGFIMHKVISLGLKGLEEEMKLLGE